MSKLIHANSEQFISINSFKCILELNQVIIKLQIMSSKKESKDKQSKDNDNMGKNQNNDKKNDLEKDNVKDSERENENELDSEKNEASRYNEEKYLNSKRINKHDQPTDQSDLTDEEKADLKKGRSEDENRIVN